MPPAVMVVDDDPNDMEITRICLARSGRELTVLSAGRGEEALALLRDRGERPSLILLDLKMPGMNGIDTLRVIRSDDRLKNIPVLIVTNSRFESDREAALGAGANGFVHKAYDMDEFCGEINAELGRWIKD